MYNIIFIGITGGRPDGKERLSVLADGDAVVVLFGANGTELFWIFKIFLTLLSVFFRNGHKSDLSVGVLQEGVLSHIAKMGVFFP